MSRALTSGDYVVKTRDRLVPFMDKTFYNFIHTKQILKLQSCISLVIRISWNRKITSMVMRRDRKGLKVGTLSHHLIYHGSRLLQLQPDRAHISRLPH